MSSTPPHPKLLEEAKAQAVMRRSLPQHVTHANRRIPGLYVRMADFIVSSGLIEVTDEKTARRFLLFTSENLPARPRNRLENIGHLVKAMPRLEESRANIGNLACAGF
jgi:hypothetical protein